MRRNNQEKERERKKSRKRAKSLNYFLCIFMLFNFFIYMYFIKHFFRFSLKKHINVFKCKFRFFIHACIYDNRKKAIIFIDNSFFWFILYKQLDNYSYIFSFLNQRKKNENGNQTETTASV